MAKKVSSLAILAALALVLSYTESFIPLNVAVPGIKLGLGNAVVLLTMLLIDVRSAYLIMLLKVILSGLAFLGLSGLIYSAAGGAVATTIMAVAYKWGRFSPVGISVIGAVSHNFAQIAVAILVTNTPGLIGYLPPLLISGVITGIVTGLIVRLIHKRMSKLFDFQYKS